MRKSLGHCASCKHCLYPDDASLRAAALGLRPKPFSIRQKIHRNCIPIRMSSRNLTNHYSGGEVSRRRRLPPRDNRVDLCQRLLCLSLLSGCHHGHCQFSSPNSILLLFLLHIVNLILILVQIFYHPRPPHHIH